MQALTHRNIAYFDRSIDQLRIHVDLQGQSARQAA